MEDEAQFLSQFTWSSTGEKKKKHILGYIDLFYFFLYALHENIHILKPLLKLSLKKVNTL